MDCAFKVAFTTARHRAKRVARHSRSQHYEYLATHGQRNARKTRHTTNVISGRHRSAVQPCPGASACGTQSSRILMDVTRPPTPDLPRGVCSEHSLSVFAPAEVSEVFKPRTSIDERKAAGSDRYLRHRQHPLSLSPAHTNPVYMYTHLGLGTVVERRELKLRTLTFHVSMAWLAPLSVSVFLTVKSVVPVPSMNRTSLCLSHAGNPVIADLLYMPQSC